MDVLLVSWMRKRYFTLRSRGIPKKEAKALLTYAFANNVLESVQLPSLEKAN